jgi:hypothetical protein
MKRIFITIIPLLTLVCVNPISGQEKRVNFNNEYVKNNNDKTTIEINETQELVYLILSITDLGTSTPNMTNQNTEYFQDIKAHFGQYSNLPVVHKFNTLLSENLINYFILGTNAYGFEFEGNKIVPTKVYNFLAKGVGNFEVDINPIVTYKKDLEEFAEKSGYRKFYKDHKKYYNDLKAEYQKYAAIEEQKKWLENKFDFKINSYRVLTSPLIAGLNATQTFEDNNFKEILLFLPTIRNNKQWSEKFNQAINTRIIFTEIDHNYVGPDSEKNLDTINSIFDKREKWVNVENKGTEHYPNALRVYDEYLTWGTFILYSYDKYGSEKELFNQIVENVNDMMINKKGFPKAKEFNEELLNLYKKSEDKKMEGLYKPLFEWSKKQ